MSIDATGTESHPFQAELQTHSSVDVQPEPRQPGPPGVGKSAPMPAQGEAGVGGRQRAGSAKRKRVARACAACRTKKTKCDSQTPACSSCLESSSQCVYDVDKRADYVSVSTSYLAQLEERINDLESRQRPGSSPRQDNAVLLDTAHNPASDPSQANVTPSIQRKGTPSNAGSTANGRDGRARGNTVDYSSLGSPSGAVSAFLPPHSSAYHPALGAYRQPQHPQQPQLADHAKVLLRPDLPIPTRTQHTSTRDLPHFSIDYTLQKQNPATTKISPIDNNRGTVVSSVFEDSEGDDTPTTRTTRQAGLRGKIATDESNMEYFDTVSSVSFTSLILSTLSLSDSDIVTAMSRTASEAYDEVRQGSTFWEEIESTSWPEPRIATDLFNHYFAHTHQIYPILHEGTIRQTYGEFYNEILKRRTATYPTLSSVTAGTEFKPTQTDRVTVALFEVLFAMVETHIGRMSGHHESHKFTGRVRRIFRMHSEWPPSLVKVQVLLLTTLLLHASDPGDACLCYDLVGAAVRTAYALGLHTDWHPEGPIALRECRRRAWWACSMLDRLLSVTLARPPSVTRLPVRLPMPQSLPDESSDSVDLFNRIIELSDVLAHLVEDPVGYYGQEIDTFFNTAYNNILRMEIQLAKWADDLAPNFSLGQDIRSASPAAMVLILDALNTRLMIHRPVLAVAIDKRVNTTMVKPSLLRPGYTSGKARSTHGFSLLGVSLSALLDTSFQLVDILGRNTYMYSLSSRWSRLTYSVSAFMSLAAALTFTLSDWAPYIRHTDQEIFQCLRQCRTIIDDLVGGPPNRTLEIVDRLMHVLSQKMETLNPATETSHNAFDTQSDLASDVMMSMPLWDRMMDTLGDGTFSQLGHPSVDLDMSMFSAVKQPQPHGQSTFQLRRG